VEHLQGTFACRNVPSGAEMQMRNAGYQR
jgi:hypothetical protein